MTGPDALEVLGKMLARLSQLPVVTSCCLVCYAGKETEVLTGAIPVQCFSGIPLRILASLAWKLPHFRLRLCRGLLCHSVLAVCLFCSSSEGTG